MKKLFLAALTLAILPVGILSAMPTKTPAQPASVSQPSPICQYPDRWTNPPGGCDNSDPAVPECIKEFSTQEGERACIDKFVADHQTPAPIEPVQWEGK